MATPHRFFRQRGTRSNGGGFDLATKLYVWGKAQAIQGQDPNTLRLDVCKKVIEFSKYGDTNSSRGWEIDHIYPVAKGGTDDLSNLQALQWQNNRGKGDDYPGSCTVTGW